MVHKVLTGRKINATSKKRFRGAGYRSIVIRRKRELTEMFKIVEKRTFTTSVPKKAVDPFTTAVASAAAAVSTAPVSPLLLVLNSFTFMSLLILAVAHTNEASIEFNFDFIFTSGLETDYVETGRASLISNFAQELEQGTRQLEAALPSILETSSTEFLHQMRDSLRYTHLIIDGSGLNDPFMGAFHDVFRWGLTLERSENEYMSEILSYIILDIAWPALRNAGNAISSVLEQITNHLDDGAHGPIRWFEY